MVFSVIGDSDSFVPRPWPKTVFQTALIEAAKSAGETWILFRGNDEGVSKIVKDAYRNYEDLHFETETISKDDHNRHVKLISIAREKNRNMSNEEQERSATHTCANTKGMQFLLEFEDFVSKKPLDYFGEDMNFNITTPITLIVCEGDIQTISHISKALRNQLPVIIMKGSGKATDVVLEYLEKYLS
uniref:TRPM SLOG domain-containing protein n=1 Tax=Magallana gigas TaxID=29159 RepID=A0A8W8NIW9_MAGGI